MKKKKISEEHPEKYVSKLTRYSYIFLPEMQLKIKRNMFVWPKTTKNPHRCL